MTKMIMLSSKVGPKKFVIKKLLSTTASLNKIWSKTALNSKNVTKMIMEKNNVNKLWWIALLKK